MPKLPAKPCNKAGCRKYVVANGYCQDHQDQVKQKDSYRGTAHQRGYDHQWRKARLEFLESNPLCVMCQRDGFTKAANVVDHIKPHKGDKSLFWDKSNWQALCKRCHDTKTASEDMGSWSKPASKN